MSLSPRLKTLFEMVGISRTRMAQCAKDGWDSTVLMDDLTPAEASECGFTFEEYKFIREQSQFLMCYEQKRMQQMREEQRMQQMREEQRMQCMSPFALPVPALTDHASSSWDADKRASPLPQRQSPPRFDMARLECHSDSDADSATSYATPIFAERPAALQDGRGCDPDPPCIRLAFKWTYPLGQTPAVDVEKFQAKFHEQYLERISHLPLHQDSDFDFDLDLYNYQSEYDFCDHVNHDQADHDAPFALCKQELNPNKWRTEPLPAQYQRKRLTKRQTRRQHREVTRRGYQIGKKNNGHKHQKGVTGYGDEGLVYADAELFEPLELEQFHHETFAISMTSPSRQASTDRPAASRNSPSECNSPLSIFNDPSWHDLYDWCERDLDELLQRCVNEMRNL